MKKRRLFKTIIGFSVLSLSLTGCVSYSSTTPSQQQSPTNYEETPVVPVDDYPNQTFVIIWLNWDNSILDVNYNVSYNSSPVFRGPTPTRPDDDSCTYRFIGWSSSEMPGYVLSFLPPVIENATYIATYIQEEKPHSQGNEERYTITWLNWDYSVLETDYDVPSGDVPSYDGAIPTRDSDGNYRYTFIGWSPTISPVTCDTTYIAQYSQESVSYTVTWINWDGSVLETDYYVEYGSTPSYDGEAPTRDSVDNYEYEFSGWSPSLSPVTSNITYTAQFETIVLLTNVALSKTYLFINVGESFSFGLSRSPYNANEKLTLETEDSDLIRLNGDGSITAIAPGETKVFVQTKLGIKSEAIVKIAAFEEVSDFTMNNWSNPAYFVTETATISDIHFSFQTNTNENSTSQRMNYSMILTKTYSYVSYSAAFKINWKVYNPNNVIIDSGTFTSSSFYTGESTLMSDFTYLDWSSSNPGGLYRVTFAEVAW